MKISIIIPNYNKAKYLKQCIESCFNQTYETSAVNFETESVLVGQRIVGTSLRNYFQSKKQPAVT